MSGSDLEQRVSQEQISAKEKDQGFNSGSESVSKDLINKLKHSSDLAGDLASLYADRPYVYARVIQQLGKNIGANQVKKIHAQVLNTAKTAAVSKTREALSAAKDKAKQKKAAEEAVRTNVKQALDSAVSVMKDSLLSKAKEVKDVISAKAATKAQSDKGEKKVESDKAEKQKAEKKEKKQQAVKAEKAAKSGGTKGAGGGSGGGGGSSFGGGAKSGGAGGGVAGGGSGGGGGSSFGGGAKSGGASLDGAAGGAGGSFALPSIGGGGGETVTPKGKGSGDNAFASFAASGLSYQLENSGELSSEVSSDLEKKKGELDAKIPGEEGVEVNDGQADAKLQSSMDASKTKNEGVKNTEFDTSVTANASSDEGAEQIEQAKSQVSGASDEDVPEAPAIEVDYSTIDAVQEEGNAKFAEAQSSGAAAVAGLDLATPVRGFNDLHTPKKSIDDLTAELGGGAGGTAADVAAMTEEAKGILDMTEEAEGIYAEMEGYSAQAKEAEMQCESEAEEQARQYEEDVNKAIEDANKQEEDIIKQQEAERDAQIESATSEYEDELGNLNDAQQAEIANAESKIDAEKSKAQGEIDKQINDAKAKKKAKEKEAEEKKKGDKSWFEKAVEWVEDKINSIVNWLKEAVAAIVTFVKDAICALLDGLVAVVKYINKDLGEKLEKLVDDFKKVLDKLAEALINVINAFLDLVGSLINALLETVVAIVTGDWDRFVAAWKNVWDNFKNLMSSLLDAALACLSALGDLFLIILKQACDLAGAQELYGRIQGVAKKIIDDPGTFFATLGRGFVEGFKLFGTNIGANIKAILGNLVSMWLGTAGLKLPDFSVAGLIKFSLEVMGIDVDSILKTLGLENYYKDLQKKSQLHLPEPLENATAVKENPRLKFELQKAQEELDEKLAEKNAAMAAGNLTDEEINKLEKELAAAQKKKNGILEKNEKLENKNDFSNEKKEEINPNVKDDNKDRALESFIKDLKSQGIKAMLPELMKRLGGIVLDITNEIIKGVLKDAATKGIAKLATMCNPVGGIIAAIKAAWDLIQFVRSNLDAIAGLAGALLDCVESAANGDSGCVASAVEAALCQAIPLVIDLLLRLAGINIGAKLKKILEGVQSKVRSALDAILKPLKQKAADWTAKAKKGIDNLAGKTDNKLVKQGLNAASDYAGKKEEDFKAFTQKERDDLKKKRDAEEKVAKKQAREDQTAAYRDGNKYAGAALVGNALSDKVSGWKSAQKGQVFKVTDLKGALSGNRSGTLGVKLDNSKALKKVDAYYDRFRENEKYEKNKARLEELQGKMWRLNKDEKKKALKEINSLQESIGAKEDADRKAKVEREMTYLDNLAKLESLQSKDVANMTWYEKIQHEKELDKVKGEIQSKEKKDGYSDPLAQIDGPMSRKNGFKIFAKESGLSDFGKGVGNVVTHPLNTIKDGVVDGAVSVASGYDKFSSKIDPSKKAAAEQKYNEDKAKYESLQSVDTSKMTPEESKAHAIKVMAAYKDYTSYDPSKYSFKPIQMNPVEQVIQSQAKEEEKKDKDKANTAMWASLGSRDAAYKYYKDASAEAKTYKLASDYGSSDGRRMYQENLRTTMETIHPWGKGNKEVRDEYKALLFALNNSNVSKKNK